MSFLLPSAPRPHALATVARAATTAAKAGAEADRDLTLADVKGSNADGVWGEVPEDLYFVANYAAALGGDYPPENVDKSYWDQIKPATFAKLAALSKSADPTTISQGQYVMLMEAIVREVRFCVLACVYLGWLAGLRFGLCWGNRIGWLADPGSVHVCKLCVCCRRSPRTRSCSALGSRTPS